VNNGLKVKLDCTALFAINREMAAEVHSKVATSVQELYAWKRGQIGVEIEETLRGTVASKGIPFVIMPTNPSATGMPLILNAQR
jgi:hypothetical protein